MMREPRVESPSLRLLFKDLNRVLQDPRGANRRMAEHILLFSLNVSLAFPLSANMGMSGLLKTMENRVLLFL